nr:sulfite exporter TauE/SafE family protein [uncultured Caproiciproducens sp.]
MTVYQQILIACPLIFLASFVDAVAGGGGLISLPAYYLTGMTSHFAIGSNKFSSCIGTMFSAGRFLKDGSFNMRVALTSAGFALVGSYAGARLTLILDDHFLRVTMLVLLPFAAFAILFSKKKGSSDINTFGTVPARRAMILSAIIGLVLGMYDGFFGPGTGTFLIIAFTAFLGFDYKTACGNTKVVNLASNVAALVTFVAAGKIQYAVAAPAAVCSIAGHWIDSSGRS